MSCRKQTIVANYLKRFSGDGMINYKGKNETGAVLTFHVNIKIIGSMSMVKSEKYFF